MSHQNPGLLLMQILELIVSPPVETPDTPLEQKLLASLNGIGCGVKTRLPSSPCSLSSPEVTLWFISLTVYLSDLRMAKIRGRHSCF